LNENVRVFGIRMLVFARYSRKESCPPDIPGTPCLEVLLEDTEQDLEIDPEGEAPLIKR
jgi:hypothetical protein